MPNCPQCNTQEAYVGFSTIECKNQKCQHHVVPKGNKVIVEDEPTNICLDGTKEWRQNGFRHRDGDKPAIIKPDGTKFWYKDGKCHRDGDKPAIIWADGSEFWYKDGKRHRDGGKPAVILTDKSKL